MRIARVQLIVAAILFVGWLGYLAYLALGHSQPVVVSRTQLMNATSFPTLPDISGSWVVAEVDVDESGKPRRTIRIKQIVSGDPIAEESVIVSNLPEARIPPNKPVSSKGLYLLPLFKKKEFLRYWIASTRWGDEAGRGPLIYRWTPEIEAQLKQLVPANR